MNGDDLAVGMREDIAVKTHRDCFGGGISQVLVTLDNAIAIQLQRSVVTGIAGNTLHAIDDIAEQQRLDGPDLNFECAAVDLRPETTALLHLHFQCVLDALLFESEIHWRLVRAVPAQQFCNERRFCRQPLRVI